jgi:hypothetical protein
LKYSPEAAKIGLYPGAFEPGRGRDAMNEEGNNGKLPGGKTDDFLPPLDFSYIVLPLYTQALVKLGLVEDPVTQKPDIHLPYAKRLIDILDLLKDRTNGRLEPDEEKFLEACLDQLKSHYLEKAEILKF